MYLSAEIIEKLIKRGFTDTTHRTLMYAVEIGAIKDYRVTRSRRYIFGNDAVDQYTAWRPSRSKAGRKTKHELSLAPA